MATAQQPKNRKYFLRLKILTIDGVTPVIQKLFDEKLSSAPLANYLQQEKYAIYQLKQCGKITDEQYALLYPSSGQPSSKNFDITLLLCLLRNMKACGLRRKYPWYATPQQSDTSLEADICRLREVRNKLAHRASTSDFDKASFLYEWQTLEQVLLRLNSSLQNGVVDLQKQIDSFKTVKYDPKEERRLQELDAMEKDLETRQTQITQEQVNQGDQVIQADLRRRLRHVKESLVYQERNFDRYNEDTMEYIKRKDEFVKELTTLYESKYRTVTVSPLVTKNDDALLNFYVEPVLEIVNRGAKSQERTKVRSYRDLFKTEPEKHDVFLTGQAGSGKTTFSQLLCILWCYTKTGRTIYHKGLKSLLAEMTKFEILFFIPLRDCCDLCNVDNMIFKEVFRNVSRPTKYGRGFMEELLHSEKCLIILEGLDEWSHPTKGDKSLRPEQTSRDRCLFLTTTRHWKMNEISVNNVPSHIELSGIDRNSQEVLINKVIKYFESLEKPVELRTENNKTLSTLILTLIGSSVPFLKKERNATELIQIIESKGLKDSAAIPVVLVQLTCIWLEKNGVIGKTKSDIYCNMIDLFLELAEKKVEEGEDNDLIRTAFESVLVNRHMHSFSNLISLENNASCEKYRPFLLTIGKLAYTALFTSKKESSLAIKSTTVAELLSTDDIRCSLEIGLLKMNESRSIDRPESTYSFIHKTFQEFFCAFYLVHLGRKCISSLDECKSLKSILEMENVFVFICGLDATLVGALSQKLTEEIGHDEVTCDHRGRVRLWFDESLNKVTQLRDYQNMILACIRECGDVWEENEQQTNNEIYLEDIFLEKASLENERESLEKLFEANTLKSDIKSVTLGGLDLPEFRFGLTMLERSRVEVGNLKKLNIYSEIEPEMLNELLERCTNIECLSICSYKNQSDGTTKQYNISLSDNEIDTLLGLMTLNSLTLECFKLDHCQLEKLINFLNKGHQMREIRLMSLSCSTHDGKQECPGFELELSRHSNLTAFEIDNVPICRASLNSGLLEECFIGKCPYLNVVESVSRCLSDLNHMRLLSCSNLSPGDVNKCLNAISQMTELEQLMLIEIDLNAVDVLLLFKVLAKIRYIWLFRSKISCVALKNIVAIVESPKQQALGNQQAVEGQHTKEDKPAGTDRRVNENQHAMAYKDGGVVEQTGTTDEKEENRPDSSNQHPHVKQQTTEHQEDTVNREGGGYQLRQPINSNIECSLRVTVNACDVRPRREFRALKKTIKESKKFRVFDDWNISPYNYKFSFEKSKDCSKDLVVERRSNFPLFNFFKIFCLLVLFVLFCSYMFL